MRKRNRDIKTYEVDLNGNTSNGFQNTQSIQVNNLSETEEYDRKEEIIRQHNQNMAREHEVAIRTNPFMFRSANSEKCNIHSIEDFIVKVKRKEERPIKEVLRTGEFRPNKKKKVILGAIKNWIKDFKENKDKVLLRVSDIKESVRPGDIKKIKLGAYIFLPLGLILLLVIYFNLTSVWGINKDFNLFGRTMHLSFQEAKDAAFASNWVNIITVGGIYLAVASILFIGLYQSICYEFIGYTKKHNNLSGRLSNKVNSDFDSKSKKTLRYYKKVLRKKECKMEPLPIEQTGVTDVDFSDLEALSDAYTHKMAKMKGRKTFLYVTQFILFKGTYLCATGVVGYVIVELVMGLFKGGVS